MPPARPSLRHVAPLAFAVALLGGGAVLFRGALFHGEHFYLRDLLAYYLPAKALLVRLVREAGGIPEWNPFFAAGQPFAANPEHALFHPLTWLLLVLPFEWAYRLQVILPVLLCGPTMFLLLRTLGRSRLAASFGGVSWAFGGYVLSTTSLLPILFAVAALPASIAFALRAYRSGRARDVAATGLSLGWMALAGEPSTLLVTPLLLAAALASELLRRGAAAPARAEGGRAASVPIARRIAAPAAGVLLGVLLGAVTLLPGALLVRKTTRAGGLPRSEASSWSMPPLRLVELVLPRALGRGEMGPQLFFAPRLYGSRQAPFLYSLYGGLLATFLAALALTSGSVRRRLSLGAWVAAALAGVVLALGSGSPAWELLRTLLPPLRGLRFPEKFALVACFALVVLSAHGADVLLGARRRLAPRAAGFAAVVALAAWALPFGLSRLEPSALSELMSAGLGARDHAVRFAVPLLEQAARKVSLAATAYAAAAFLLRRRRVSGGVALIAAVAFDLVLDGQRLTLSRPVPMEPPPILRPLVGRPDGAPLLHLAGWTDTWEIKEGIFRPPRPALWGIPTVLELDFDRTELRWSVRARELFAAALEVRGGAAWALVRRRGAAAVIQFRDDRRIVPTGILPGDVSDGIVSLRHVDRPMPFAFSPSAVLRLTGEEDWIWAVKRLGPAAASTVTIDGTDVPSGFPSSFSPASVSVLSRRPDAVELLVEAGGPRPAFVAVNQTWDAGWRARVDGARAAVHRVDISLSGLVVPPGRHRVELFYRDPSISVGLAVSLAALLSISGLLTFGRRRLTGRAA